MMTLVAAQVTVALMMLKALPDVMALQTVVLQMSADATAHMAMRVEFFRFGLTAGNRFDLGVDMEFLALWSVYVDGHRVLARKRRTHRQGLLLGGDVDPLKMGR